MASWGLLQIVSMSTLVLQSVLPSPRLPSFSPTIYNTQRKHNRPINVMLSMLYFHIAMTYYAIHQLHDIMYKCII